MAINTNSIDEVVRAYFERLEERGLGEWVDKVFPNESVFEEIRRLAGLSAEEVVERLAQAVSERLLPEVAEEAVGVPRPAAVWYLARRIAMWYLQLAEELGVVRGVWRWRRSSSYVFMISLLSSICSRQYPSTFFL